MADGKRGFFIEHKTLVVDWLEEKVDQLHDRYGKFHRYSSYDRHILTFSFFRLIEQNEKKKLTEKWTKVNAKMSAFGTTCKSATQWQKHWVVRKKQLNNKYD